MDKIIRQYDSIGAKYKKEQKDFYKNKADNARKFIKNSLDFKNKRILDIGCGFGADIKIYEKMGANDVYGIDASKFMVSEAKNVAKNPEKIFLASIEKTPFPRNFFDIVIGRHSLHYLKKFDKAYKEIARILKKQGILVLIVSHPLRDISFKKNKNYYKQEIITHELYHGKIKARFPSHVLSDYFSNIFFNKFYLDKLEEGNADEKRVTPLFLGFKAIKRN